MRGDPISTKVWGILVAFWDFTAGGKILSSYGEDGNSLGRCRGPPEATGIRLIMYREAFPPLEA